MGIIFYRCASGGFKSLANSQPKPEPVVTPVVANGNGHVVVALLPQREPLRLPDDFDGLVKRYNMGHKRCRGQKPQYKNHRRSNSRVNTY